jgi:hypothetical protein
MKYDINVEWTGKSPNLCHGEWIIIINGKRLGGVGNDSMGTYGTYSTWSFDENWSEEWDEYECGGYWYEELPNNLEMALKLAGFNPKDENLIKALYEKVQEQDWRHNSCGGCI